MSDMSSKIILDIVTKCKQITKYWKNQYFYHKKRKEETSYFLKPKMPDEKGE